MPEPGRLLVPSEILTPTELAKRLKVNKTWIYERMRQRRGNPLPCFKTGRYLRFYWADICEWLESTRALQGPSKRGR
jgi:excisionase family DNA binding protein